MTFYVIKANISSLIIRSESYYVSFCILYHVVSVKHSVQYFSSWKEGILAYCDLMSVELSL